MSTRDVKAATSRRDELLEDLHRWRAVLVDWQHRLAVANDEFDQLSATAGDELLDRPEAADEITRRTQELRARIEAAERAVEAAGPRVWAAESAYLTAEADLLEFDVAAAQDALKGHQRRTEALLEQLRQHEGQFVPEAALIDAQSSGGLSMVGTTFTLPKSQALADRSQQAELRVWVLREMAAGRDPHPGLQERGSLTSGTVAGVSVTDLYDACVWGPEAVVPAPAYVRAVGSDPVVIEAPEAELVVEEPLTA